MKRLYYDISTFFEKKIIWNYGVNVMKSNFDQETIFIALSNAKSLEILTRKVLWATVDIDKNICFHFRIGIMEKSIEFILGDQLPLIYKAVIAIHGYSPCGSPKEGRESKVRKKVVNAYVTSLTRTWVKAFELENVAPCITVAKMIWTGLESHFNSVLCKGSSAMPKRERLWQRRESSKVNCLLDILKSKSDPNSFDENEKLFYFAQKAT